MSIRAYDFRNPERPAGSLEPLLAGWMRATSQQLPERCEEYLPIRVEMECKGIEGVSPTVALGRLPEACVGYRVQASRTETISFPSPTAHKQADDNSELLFVWSRPLTLALVTALLGEEGEELPTDRNLTVVEQSLFEYLAQHFFANFLQETWPGRIPLKLTITGPEPSPRWSRMFVGTDRVLLCSCSLRGPFGEGRWEWLIPVPGGMEALVEPQMSVQLASPQAKESRLEPIVRQMGVEVVVNLGCIELPLSQVARLQVGDLLILDQQVSSPLIACVNGQKKFVGWPGRVGERQALQINTFDE